MRNLLANLPDSTCAEAFETLVETATLRVERIVSTGQCLPPDFWYDQPEHEWVLLLAGAARLTIVGQGEIDLRPGDSLNIPAHARHRVEWTEPTQATIWLAVFYKD